MKEKHVNKRRCVSDRNGISKRHRKKFPKEPLMQRDVSVTRRCYRGTTSMRRMYEVININTYRSSSAPITRYFSLRSVKINDIEIAVQRACDQTLIFTHETKQEYFQNPYPSDRVNKKHWFENDDDYLRKMLKNFLHVVAMIPIMSC